MSRITIAIDLKKIDKSRIKDHSFTTKSGEVVTQKLYELDVVELRPENHKTLMSGEGWARVKKYMVVNTATNEERAQKVNTAIVGEGFVFVDTNPGTIAGTGVPYPTGSDTGADLSKEDLPF